MFQPAMAHPTSRGFQTSLGSTSLHEGMDALNRRQQNELDVVKNIICRWVGGMKSYQRLRRCPLANMGVCKTLCVTSRLLHRMKCGREVVGCMARLWDGCIGHETLQKANGFSFDSFNALRCIKMAPEDSFD